MARSPNDPGWEIPGHPAYEVLRPLCVSPPANRGGEITLAPPTGDFVAGVLDGPSKAIFETRADGVRRAELLGITFGLRLEKKRPVDFLQEGVPLVQSVRAQLKWGKGGVQFQAEVDVLHGTLIGLNAENVSVAARYLKRTLPWDPAPSDPTKDPSFVVTSGIGYLASGGNTNTARLTELVQIETQQSPVVDVPIPPFASSFTVVPIVGASLVQAIAFGTTYAANYVVASPLTNGQHDVENAFPLYNGAQFLRVSNGGQGVMIANVIFGLTFP